MRAREYRIHDAADDGVRSGLGGCLIDAVGNKPGPDAIVQRRTTLRIYVRYESAIAELIAPRMPELAPQEPRPRLIGALAMAAIRIALGDWLNHAGSLPDWVRQGLAVITIA